MGGRATQLLLNQKTNEAVKPQVNFKFTYFPLVILDMGEEAEGGETQNNHKRRLSK